MPYEELFGLDASVVSEANFATVFGNLLEGVFLGISDECRVDASAPAAMTVEVGTGTFITGGVFGRVSAAETLVIGAAPGAGNERIDRVVLRRDQATNTLTLVILPGVPAVVGAAIPTALTRNGIYETSLARVYVGPVVVAINAEDITDERGEPAICGYVSGKAYEQVDRNHVEGNRQWGAWSGYGSQVLVALAQLYAQSMIIDNASIRVRDADGIGLRQDTQAVLNDSAYILGAYNTVGPVAAPCHARRYWTVWECKFKLAATTLERLFVGLHSSFDPAVVLVDAPVGDYAALQYSTSRADTNFQFTHQVNAGVQQVLDTGIVVDTAAHIFRIVCRADETWMLLELLDTNRNIEASAWIAGATLPTLATNLYPWSGIRTLVAGAKSLTQYYAKGVNRKT